MKSAYRLFSSILLLAAITLLAAGCSDEPLMRGDKLPPGTEVEMQLAMSIPMPLEADVVTSRADADAKMNRQVYDFYLFIFDENDRLISRYYFPDVTGQRSPCDAHYSTTATASVIRDGLSKANIYGIRTTTGRRRIMGVANVNVRGSSMLLGRLAAVTNVDELKAITGSLETTESTVFTMAGYYGSGGNVETVEPGQEGIIQLDTPTPEGVIRLVPLQSRVRFIIDGNGHEAVLNDDGTVRIPAGKFVLETWQVFRMPTSCPLFPSDAYTTGSTFNSVIKTEFSENVGDKPNTFGFTFFTFETKPEPREGAEITSYADRAKWDNKTGAATEGVDKQWANAPDMATFVVLKGKYTGASKVTYQGLQGDEVRNVEADVTYTIFLGHDSDRDFTDFNTLRNFNYTYKVNIRGVNTISVEVDTKEDSRPDGEGHIIVSDNARVELDAHYCQRVVDFTVGSLRNAIDQKHLAVSVRVPPRGVSRQYIYDPEAEGFNPDETLPEFSWIEAYIHKDDQKSHNYVSYTDAYRYRTDIFHLLKALYEKAGSDAPDDEIVRVTLYFDEYYYENDKWKQIVNTEPRTFSLFGSTAISSDHNSSLTVGATTFSQLPIRTTYAVVNSEVERAWGIESIEEPIRADGSTTMREGVTKCNISGGSSRFGRQNQWRMIYHGVSTADFNEFIDSDGNLKENCRNEAVMACMLRNRDLNGNGEIDADELRWYTPSIEQLQQLYVGRNVLPADVQLYNHELERAKFNGNKWRYKHYISSTNNQILWSEEGGSSGGMKDWRSGEDYYVRCARDLGTRLGTKTDGVPWNIDSHEDTQFQSTVHTYDPDPGREHVAGRLSLDRLNRGALRLETALIDVQGNVTTFTSNNAPVIEFEWADTLINRNGAVSCLADNALAAAVPQGETLCRTVLGRGWRQPTLSELIALWWALGSGDMLSDKDGSHKGITIQCRSTYHFKSSDGFTNPKGEGRQNHIFDDTGGGAAQFTLTKPNEKSNGYIRCVRDYVPDINDNETENTDSPSAVRARRVVRKPRR